MKPVFAASQRDLFVYYQVSEGKETSHYYSITVILRMQVGSSSFQQQEQLRKI